MIILEKINVKNEKIFRDLQITLGDCTLIHGMNGSGKSTILNYINVLTKSNINEIYSFLKSNGLIEFYFNSNIISNLNLQNPIIFDLNNFKFNSHNVELSKNLLNSIFQVKFFNFECVLQLSDTEKNLSNGDIYLLRLQSFLENSSNSIILIDGVFGYFSSKIIDHINWNDLKKNNQIIITTQSQYRDEFDFCDIKIKLFPSYIDHLFQVSSNSKYYDDFKLNLDNIRKIVVNSELIVDNLRKILYKMSYANIITIMETFLTNAVINLLDEDFSNDIHKSLLSTISELGNEKIKLSEIYEEFDSIKDRIKSFILNSIVFHNIPRIRPIFEKALKIPFPENIGQIIKAVETRHDIVHRNGRTLDGNDIILTKIEVLDLIILVENFIDEINNNISKKY